MKNVFHFLIITLLLFFSQTVFTQTVQTVEVKSFSFTPAQLTIKVGDTVRWTNTLGFHSVVANDNSFTSGPASSSSWVFEFVFNTPGTYPYHCSVHGASGGVGMSGVITVETATDIQDEDISIYKFDLEQNYPNPFNPSTKIKYTIPSVGTSLMKFVQIKVYDVLGNEVATLVNEEKPAGIYEVEFSAKGGSASGGDARNLSSGVYIYKIQVYPATSGAGSFVETKKMILLR